MLTLAADSSFTVAPSVGLVLWTVLAFAIMALVLYVLVRLAIHLRRDHRKR